MSSSKVYKASFLSVDSDAKVLPVPAAPYIFAKYEELEEKGQEYKEESRIGPERLLADAKEMAGKLLDQARQEAGRIRRQAEEEAAALKEQLERDAQQLFEQSRAAGYAEGMQEGHHQGRGEAEAEFRSRINTAAEVLRQTYEERDAIVAGAECFLLDLSVEIARKVIQQELQTNGETLLGMVREVLARSGETESVSVCVHPDDYELLHKRKDQLSAAVGQTEVRIYPDYSVREGGCIIRTSKGSMDARVDTQLEEIKRALVQAAGEDA